MLRVVAVFVSSLGVQWSSWAALTDGGQELAFGWGTKRGEDADLCLRMCRMAWLKGTLP